MSLGIYRNAGPRSDSSVFQSYNFESTFLLYAFKGSRSKASWQCEELVLYDPAFFFLNPSPVSAMLPVSSGVDLQEPDARFIEFANSAEDGSPRAGRPSKTCPDVPNDFRVRSCKQESRLIIPLGLGILMG